MTVELDKKEKEFLAEMRGFLSVDKGLERDEIKQKLVESSDADEEDVDRFLDKIYDAKKEKKSPTRAKGAKKIQREEEDAEGDIAGKEYVEVEELKTLAAKVMKDKAIDLQGACVRYLMVYPHISKTTLGKCAKASPLVKLFGGCDYVLTFSGEMFDALPTKVQELLMWHELMHIEPRMNKEGVVKYCIRDHNIKDFRCLIDDSGLDWVDELLKGVNDALDGDDKVNLDKVKW